MFESKIEKWEIETAGEFLLYIRDMLELHSKENFTRGIASNSEVRRWFKNKSIMINGKIADFDDDIRLYEDDSAKLVITEDGYDIVYERKFCKSLVLFPKGRGKTTLW